MLFHMFLFVLMVFCLALGELYRCCIYWFSSGFDGVSSGECVLMASWDFIGCSCVPAFECAVREHVVHAGVFFLMVSVGWCSARLNEICVFCLGNIRYLVFVVDLIDLIEHKQNYN